MTPEKSIEMSRPIIAKVSADPKAKPGKTSGKPGAATPDARKPEPDPNPARAPPSPTAIRA